MKNNNSMLKFVIKSFLIVFISMALLSCSSDNDERATGKANISLTDAPIDDANIKSVFISVLSVEANGPDGWETVESFEEPVKIDILSYQDGNSYFLTEGSLTAGAYSEIRLILDIVERANGNQSNVGSYIEYLDGSTQPLFVPSGAQSGYKAKGEFTIPEGGVVSLTLDLDLRKALVRAGNSGKYLLKPVVRLIANEDAALISGSLTAEATELGKVLVFAYNDGEFTESETDEPGNEEVRFPNAVTSADLDEDGSFTLAFMESGTYDLYFAQVDEEGEFISLLGSYQDVALEGGTNLTIEITLIELE
ncbi:DUF4382 domain-containing protein [Fulvivirga lutea]|uniref:DUF4382 domain-containing protein n=1 Tax=Fulvivirga lutea TaxID=2810512 RepID=A0A974WHZ4_9BACT|nr:DUF4382 domain-containing protein [Fulvivirga lutea]QSE97567.1 DUF4382 domain-containing protein [Fulvivirga lutea]